MAYNKLWSLGGHYQHSGTTWMVTTGSIGLSGMNTGILSGPWLFLVVILSWESFCLPALGRQSSEGQLQQDWSWKVLLLIQNATSSRSKMLPLCCVPLSQYTCEFWYEVKKVYWLFVNRSSTFCFLIVFFFWSFFFWLYCISGWGHLSYIFWLLVSGFLAAHSKFTLLTLCLSTLPSSIHSEQIWVDPSNLSGSYQILSRSYQIPSRFRPNSWKRVKIIFLVIPSHSNPFWVHS